MTVREGFDVQKKSSILYSSIQYCMMLYVLYMFIDSTHFPKEAIFLDFPYTNGGGGEVAP